MIETSSPKFWRSLVFTGLCRNPSVSDERSRLCAARRPGVLTLWLVFMLLPSNQVSVARLLRLCVSRWDEDSPGTKLAHSPPISVFSVSQDSLVGCVRFAHIHLRCHVFHCFKLAFPGSWWFGPKWRCVIIICDRSYQTSKQLKKKTHHKSIACGEPWNSSFSNLTTTPGPLDQYNNKRVRI